MKSLFRPGSKNSNEYQVLDIDIRSRVKSICSVQHWVSSVGLQKLQLEMLLFNHFKTNIYVVLYPCMFHHSRPCGSSGFTNGAGVAEVKVSFHVGDDLALFFQSHTAPDAFVFVDPNLVVKLGDVPIKLCSLQLFFSETCHNI